MVTPTVIHGTGDTSVARISRAEHMPKAKRTENRTEARRAMRSMKGEMNRSAFDKDRAKPPTLLPRPCSMQK